MDTTDPTFPHHWECQHTSGHPVNQEECVVRDGSTRCPDGSIICRDKIQRGDIFFIERDITGNVIGIHDVDIPNL